MTVLGGAEFDFSSVKNSEVVGDLTLEVEAALHEIDADRFLPMSFFSFVILVSVSSGWNSVEGVVAIE